MDTALGLSPDQLNEKVASADALIIRSATQVTADVFAASGGRLKVVGRAGVGVDNVDLGALLGRLAAAFGRSKNLGVLSLVGAAQASYAAAILFFERDGELPDVSLMGLRDCRHPCLV